MGHDRDMNYVNIIQNALSNYQGFTSSEKKYCTDNLAEWITEDDSSLDVLISKFNEKSLDMKPFLKQTGLMA